LYSTENYRIETPENRILSLNSQIILNNDEDQLQKNGKIKIRNNSMSLNYDVNHMYEDLYNENNNKKNDGFIEDEDKKSNLNNHINQINKIKGNIKVTEYIYIYIYMFFVLFYFVLFCFWFVCYIYIVIWM